MKLLDLVHKGRKEAPRRVMLYGTQGIGKSTFGSMSENPIFIQTEDGLSEVDCDKFPLSQSYDDVMNALAELYTSEHSYKTVVLDSLDWLEKLIWNDVCKKRNVDNIEDIGYAKGYTFALSQWREFLNALDALRNDRGMMVIFISHAKIERFDNPETDPYDRYAPKLHKLASAVIQEWCDEVLFATYKVHTKQSDEGFNKKRIQGVGTGERVIHTTERPAYLAKNRLCLPNEIPLLWSAYADFFIKSNGQPTESSNNE